MTTGITRRDFMNGIAVAVAGAAGVDLAGAQGSAGNPPALPPGAPAGETGASISPELGRSPYRLRAA
jgi:hypothetical protein